MSSVFYRAVLESARDETPQLRALRLRVDPAVAASYVRAGQFLKVRLPGQDPGAYFAIASGPDGPTLELLVKRGEGLPDELVVLAPGALLETTLAMGDGFPVEESRGSNVLLFATGSGIAPIRAALQEIEADRRAWGDVHLFFGVRSMDDFPYARELEGWASRGIRVHRVISKGTGSEPAYVGYVQQRFRAELPPVEGAVAFLCGLKGMIDGVTEVLVEHGLPASRIHLNT